MIQKHLRRNKTLMSPSTLFQTFFLSLALCLLLPGIVQAGTNFRQLYGLSEKKELEAMVAALAKESALHPAEGQNLKALGIAWHNLAVLKSSGAPDAAVAWLEKARQALPEDAEVTAYLGSARTMIARDTWNLFTKTTQVNKGINLLDRAVGKAPDNIVVRMVRAKNSLRLPFFLNRKGMALKDLLEIEGLMASPSSGVSNELRAEVFQHLAALYQEDGNDTMARQYLHKSLSAAPNSAWGEASKKRLSNLPPES